MRSLILIIGIFIILQLCSGCRVERHDETITTVQSDPTLSEILEETCGQVTPACRKEMCIETVAAWYTANHVTEPTNIHGGY